MSELLNGRVFILLRAQRRLHWAQAIVAAARHPQLRQLGQNGDVLFRRAGEAASVTPVWQLRPFFDSSRLELSGTTWALIRAQANTITLGALC